jgi:hypothetical protein
MMVGPAAASPAVPTNDTFTYVFIPADMASPMEERTEDATGGLEEDKLINGLKAGSELGPSVDITALTVPTKASKFIAVSVYMDGNDPAAKGLPVNRRLMGLLEAAGLAPQDEIRGPAVVSRYFDNDDAWHRVDILAVECVSDADWVRASLALNRGRKSQGSSLSDILKQQAAQMGMGGGSGGGGGNGEPVVVDGRNGGVYGAEAQAAMAAGGAQVVGADGGAVEVADGSDWIQTGDEIELTFPLPPGATKKDVKVAFKSESLSLEFAGHDVATTGLSGVLGGKVDVDGCTWTLSDGNVVVTMEKKTPGEQWSFALKKT